MLQQLPDFNARAAVVVYALAAHTHTPRFADELVEQASGFAPEVFSDGASPTSPRRTFCSWVKNTHTGPDDGLKKLGCFGVRDGGGTDKVAATTPPTVTRSAAVRHGGAGAAAAAHRAAQHNRNLKALCCGATAGNGEQVR